MMVNGGKLKKEEILDRIKALEGLSQLLDPDKTERAKMSHQMLSHAEAFLEGLGEGLTYTPPPDGFNPQFPIEENPASIQSILELVKDQVEAIGINPASGGHLGYIPGGGLVPSAWGDFLADISNRYVGIHFASPGGVTLENTMIRWLCDIVGYDRESGGTLTSGGSLAILTAVVNARDAHNIRAAEIPQTVIYLTAQTHHCAHKALQIAGLRECLIREVPMSEFKMDSHSLREVISEDLANGLKPFMVMASAGTTEAGVVDPLLEIGKIAREFNLWYHIDAAYGGFFLLTDYGKQVLKGINQADSVIIDPHKGLFLPYGSGALLVKNAAKLYQSQHYFANYMQDAIHSSPETSPADLSPELSRHFRGMRMWVPLRLFGVAPFRAALEEKLWLARYFYIRLSQENDFELGPYPELSVTFFRYKPPWGHWDAINRKLINAIQEDGRVFFSSTTLNGKFYLRLAVLNFRTHLKQIDLALEILMEKTKLMGED